MSFHELTRVYKVGEDVSAGSRTRTVIGEGRGIAAEILIRNAYLFILRGNLVLSFDFGISIKNANFGWEFCPI